MAKQKRKRRRKHRGTQGGRIDRGRRGKPRSRQEARARARSRQQDRLYSPPTWGSAVLRGIVASSLFFVLLVLAFGRPTGPSLAIAIFLLGFYIPAGYIFDRFLWRRRMRKRERARQQA